VRLGRTPPFFGFFSLKQVESLAARHESAPTPLSEKLFFPPLYLLFLLHRLLGSPLHASFVRPFSLFFYDAGAPLHLWQSVITDASVFPLYTLVRVVLR